LISLLLFFSIGPTSFLPDWLPFCIGLAKWDITKFDQFPSGVSRHGERTGEITQISSTSGDWLPWKLQYAYHRGIRQPSISAKDAMILIPAGEFVMGSPNGEGEDDEHPKHTVYLDAYYIDQHEVTNAEYKKFIDTTSHRVPQHWWKWAWRKEAHYPIGMGRHPVVGVSWEDVNAYAQWAGKRLPTEAEWEKAARGTDGRMFPWGNKFHQDIRGERVHANIYHRYYMTYGTDGTLVSYEQWNRYDKYRKSNLVEDGYKRTAPVGRFPSGASPYGVMDMAGNVLEWVADWYDSEYYMKSPERNPKGPDTGEKRVIRGGSWQGIPYYIRCAIRYYAAPNYVSQHIGFRCAKDASD